MKDLAVSELDVVFRAPDLLAGACRDLHRQVVGRELLPVPQAAVRRGAGITCAE